MARSARENNGAAMNLFRLAAQKTVYLDKTGEYNVQPALYKIYVRLIEVCTIRVFNLKTFIELLIGVKLC